MLNIFLLSIFIIRAVIAGQKYYTNNNPPAKDTLYLVISIILWSILLVILKIKKNSIGFKALGINFIVFFILSMILIAYD